MAATLRQVRPFTGKTLPTALAYRTRVLRAHCIQKQNSSPAELKDQDASASSRPNLPLAVSLALGAASLMTYRAFAEEVVLRSTPALSPEDMEILAASSAGGGIEGTIVSLLFGVVVLLLVVVTGGVAYMNITQFLDNRQENEDREKTSKEVPTSSAASEGKVDGEAEEVVSLRRASRVKKEKGKGFAASEFTSRR